MLSVYRSDENRKTTRKIRNKLGFYEKSELWVPREDRERTEQEDGGEQICQGRMRRALF